MLSQSTFIIPPEIEAGLLSGDLIQYGGIVRNQLGQIVKHLKEVQLPVSNEAAAARVAAVLKNPRVFIPTLVVGAAVIAGGAAFATARKRKKAAVPECVERYNASLGTYLEAVHEGRLEADIIDQLISALDAVVAYSDENGDSISLDFSTEQAAMLVQIVVDSTRQLAVENSIDLSELEEEAPASESGTVVDLRRYLEVQKKLFTDAA
ncbi:hypothetical protein [Actinomadura formosensis]|uniref:hypothetical protein n=1 Tax=Actinomadura formosensis TaxID=60706 RepID=UPI00082C3225|nr:hypothetical protein [Actinomadura formosensis]